MGVNTSLFTNQCKDIQFQLDNQNLNSHGFSRMHIKNNQNQQNEQNQIYVNNQTSKYYLLKTINTANYQQSEYLNKTLSKLCFIKREYLSNVIFSQIKNKKMLSLQNVYQQNINKYKIFSEYSLHNLKQLVQRKIKQKQKIDNNNKYEAKQQEIAYTNTEMAKLMINIAGIAMQIKQLKLPITRINPQNFYCLQSQRIIYDIDFNQLLQNQISIENSYFAEQLWQSQQQQSILKIGYLNQLMTQKWEDKYEKNLIFGLGMMVLHYILLEAQFDCYNYKSKQFCRSELQNRIDRVSHMLENRIKSQFNLTDVLNESIIMEFQNDSLQYLFYQTISGMLVGNKGKRIGISELKQRCTLMLERIKGRYEKTNESFRSSSNTQYLHHLKGSIKFSEVSDSRTSRKQKKSYIKRVKTIQDSLNNTSLIQTRDYSKIKHPVTKLGGNRNNSQKKQYQLNRNDKENDIDFLNVNVTKKYNDKDKDVLQGYHCVQLTQNSFLQGHFKDNMAHGLGKITRGNGEIIQCIFHNNQIIDEISLHSQKY